MQNNCYTGVNCNSNYIGIGMDITRNIKCCNVMHITIHLFGNNIPEDNGIKTFKIKFKIYFKKYLTHIIIFPKKIIYIYIYF